MSGAGQWAGRAAWGDRQGLVHLAGAELLCRWACWQRQLCKRTLAWVCTLRYRLCRTPCSRVIIPFAHPRRRPAPAVGGKGWLGAALCGQCGHGVGHCCRASSAGHVSSGDGAAHRQLHVPRWVRCSLHVGCPCTGVLFCEQAAMAHRRLHVPRLVSVCKKRRARRVHER